MRRYIEKCFYVIHVLILFNIIKRLYIINNHGIFLGCIKTYTKLDSLSRIPFIHDWVNKGVRANEMGSRIENAPAEQGK